MADWVFLTRNRAGVNLGSLTDLADRRIEVFLNQPGGVSGTLDLQSPQADRGFLEPGVHELLVTRNGVAVETVFQLAAAAVAPDPQGGGRIAFSWLGISSYLADVTLEKTFNVTDVQSTLATTIINTVQAKDPEANYGIVNGSHTPGQPSKQLKLADQGEMEAKQALELLAERENGFDFWIDTERRFNTRWPNRGSDLRNTVVLEHGNNCLITGMTEDAGPGQLTNFARVKGADGVARTASDQPSQLKYGYREAIVTDSDVVGNPASLSETAAAIVADRKTPIIIPEVLLDTKHPGFVFGTPWLGDVVTLVANIGTVPYVRIADAYRVVAIAIEINNEGYENVSMELNLVI